MWQWTKFARYSLARFPERRVYRSCLSICSIYVARGRAHSVHRHGRCASLSWHPSLRYWQGWTIMLVVLGAPHIKKLDRWLSWTSSCGDGVIFDIHVWWRPQIITQIKRTNLNMKVEINFDKQTWRSKISTSELHVIIQAWYSMVPKRGAWNIK